MNKRSSVGRRWAVVVGLLAAMVARADPAGETGPVRVSELPVEDGALHVLVDDVTGDGWQDLLFTSHGGNFVQVYRQTAPRQFEAMPQQPIAGFHPNDVIALPGLSKRYLINAEGENSLKVVKIQPDGQFGLVSSYKVGAPRASTMFTWPGWGVSLAVVPYSGGEMALLRDFDTETGQIKELYPLKFGRELKHVRLGDINGDGIPELLLTNRMASEVWAIGYPGPDQKPEPKRLWGFGRGWPRHVLPFDVNRDGALDLLVPMAVEPRIAVLVNNGKGEFTEGESIPYPGKTGIHVMTTGVDQDGARYLLAGGIRALVLYRERLDAPGRFDHVLLSLPTWPGWVELKDIDGDGWLDAAVAMHGNARSRVIYGPLWKSFAELAAQQPATPPGPDADKTGEIPAESAPKDGESAAANPPAPAPAARPAAAGPAASQAESGQPPSKPTPGSN